MKEVVAKNKKQQQIDTSNWVSDDMRAGEENPKTTNSHTQKIDSNLMNFKDFVIDHIKS